MSTVKTRSSFKVMEKSLNCKKKTKISTFSTCEQCFESVDKINKENPCLSVLISGHIINSSNLS